ncbi:MAG: hypothetical protein N3E49_09475 [Bacteroidia bacterium]|nr:hypothetical protein [Bacteroidia bacterium]
MQKKRFWNPEVADNLANEVLTIAAMKLFPDWDKVTAQAFAAFLIKTTKNVVRAFFRKFAIQKRKAQKAGEIIWKEAKDQTGSEK